MFPLKAVVEESGSWLVGVWGWKFWEGWTSEDKVLRCFFLQLRTRPSLSCRCEVRGRVKWGTGSEIFHGGRIRTTANRQPTSPRWQPRPSLEIFEARPLCRRGAARGDHLQGIFSVILTAEGWETLMGIGPHGVTYPGIMLFTECHGLLLFPLFSIDIVDTAKTPYPNCSNNAPHPHHTSSLGCTT